MVTVHSTRRRVRPFGPTTQPDTGGLDGASAQELLADLGFLLVPGPPLDAGAASLRVALRPHPTRTHFDPERIEYWTLVDGRAEPIELSWPMDLAAPAKPAPVPAVKPADAPPAPKPAEAKPAAPAPKAN